MPSIAGTADGIPAVSADKAVRLIVAEPAGVYADAIRGARRALDGRRRYPGPRVVLVTSALPNEGADTIASNLAHHYALTGSRVLLADGDLRRQPLTRQLAPQRVFGLADQLMTNRPVEAAVLRDGVTGLHFLPAAGEGPLTRSVPELLANGVTGEAFARLRMRFDVIVLSAPPILPVSDARILADYADQIVFVMTWQKTPKALAKRALEGFGPNAAKVAGVVLSEVADEQNAYADLLIASGPGPSLPGSRRAA